MSPYRATDGDLEREIAAVQGMVRVRLRRATADLRELESTLTELRRELRRRRLALPAATETSSTEPVPAGGP